MHPYAQFQPTIFDTKGAFTRNMGEDDDSDTSDRSLWLVVNVGRTRDSGTLSASNFATAEAMLEEVDPDSADHETHRFGHWGPGWFEIIIVRPGTDCQRIGEDIESSLEDYPILNEEDYSGRDWEAACEAWNCTDTRDRIEICTKHGVSIFAARRDEIPENLRHWEDFYRPTD